MLEKKIIKSKTLLSLAILLITLSVDAQNVTNYFLMPASQLILPIGSSAHFEIYWDDGTGAPKFGTVTQLTNPLPPAWTLNGQPSNIPAGVEGRLSSDLTFDKATYYAPDKVPKINPVTIAVKFKANDTTKEEVTLLCNVEIVDPGQNWYFSYSCHSSSAEIITAPFHQITKRSRADGSGSMILDAQPPQDGYVIINTEQGDKVLKSFVSGLYNYYKMDAHEDVNKAINEKYISNYSGRPETNQSLLFEYNSKDKADQGGIQGAGISFDITGTDEIWNRGANGQLRKSSTQVNEKNRAGISLGHKEDKVTKVKNGFVVDYSQSKDTSYSDTGGQKHTLKLTEEYHAELIRVNKKSK